MLPPRRLTRRALAQAARLAGAGKSRAAPVDRAAPVRVSSSGCAAIQAASGSFKQLQAVCVCVFQQLPPCAGGAFFLGGHQLSVNSDSSSLRKLQADPK
eukprot:15000624-Alexandrium_andersonii.AAC.1